MIVIEAKKPGACGACHEPIVLGERIAFSRVEGPKHLACADKPVERRNLYAATCFKCSARLSKGAGLMQLQEEQRPDGSFKRDWLVRCADATACLWRATELGAQRARVRRGRI